VASDTGAHGTHGTDIADFPELFPEQQLKKFLCNYSIYGNSEMKILVFSIIVELKTFLMKCTTNCIMPMPLCYKHRFYVYWWTEIFWGFKSVEVLTLIH
jgi:hypothetical protein